MNFKLTFDYKDWKDIKEMINSLKTLSDEKFLRSLMLSADNSKTKTNLLKPPVIEYTWGDDKLDVFIYLE